MSVGIITQESQFIEHLYSPNQAIRQTENRLYTQGKKYTPLLLPLRYVMLSHSFSHAHCLATVYFVFTGIRRIWCEEGHRETNLKLDSQKYYEIRAINSDKLYACILFLGRKSLKRLIAEFVQL